MPVRRVALRQWPGRMSTAPGFVVGAEAIDQGRAGGVQAQHVDLHAALAKAQDHPCPVPRRR